MSAFDDRFKKYSKFAINQQDLVDLYKVLPKPQPKYEPNMKLTPNFSLAELACKDGTPVPPDLVDEAKKICTQAQVLRDIVGPLEVRSGYRTEAWNTHVGGADSSLHLSASALDLHSDTFNAEQLGKIWEWLTAKSLVAKGGLGIYPREDGGWIHVDLGPKRRWRG